MDALKKTEAACATYVQGLALCEECLRNIGFYAAGQKWGQYTPKVNDAQKTQECVGFLSEDQKDD